MHYKKLFESIEKHVQLRQNEKMLLQDAFHLRKIRKGGFLLHEGAINKTQTFIINGSFITYFADVNGHDHIIQFGIEGWWIGDFQSYVFQHPATCNVRALEDSQVLEAPIEKVNSLYDSIPAFERYHRIIIQNGYAAFQQRMIQNLSMTAEQRLLAFHHKYANLELRFPQKIIASYLGMSAEFYSKLKKQVFLKNRLKQ